MLISYKPSLFALQIYASLADAYAAIAERLSGSEGDYFFGSQPSSLDALLFGHLAFHQAAPVSSPEIRHQVRLAYVTFIDLSCLKFSHHFVWICNQDHNSFGMSYVVAPTPSLRGCSSFPLRDTFL